MDGANIGGKGGRPRQWFSKTFEKIVTDDNKRRYKCIKCGACLSNLTIQALPHVFKCEGCSNDIKLKAAQDMAATLNAGARRPHPFLARRENRHAVLSFVEFGGSSEVPWCGEVEGTSCDSITPEGAREVGRAISAFFAAHNLPIDTLASDEWAQIWKLARPACLEAARLTVPLDDPPRIRSSRSVFYLFGDSITQRGFDVCNQGWCAQLANAYARQADVINRGFSGYNTNWARLLETKVVSEISVARNVRLVTIFFGANDAALAGGSSARQHVPLDRYETNLRHILACVLRALGEGSGWGGKGGTLGGSCAIVLITPPPVDQEARKEEIGSSEPERTLDQAQQYAAACQRAAAEVCRTSGRAQICCLDLFGEMIRSDNWRDFLGDGLHLSARGNTFLFNRLQELIGELGLHLSMDAPTHDLIDPANPTLLFK